MIVDVMLVRVGRYEKSVFALQEAPSEFIADPIGLFRRDLARLDGLAYLGCGRTGRDHPGENGKCRSASGSSDPLCEKVLSDKDPGKNG